MTTPTKRKKLEPWQLEDSERLKSAWDSFKAATGASQENFCAEHGLGSQANVGHYIHGRQGLTIDSVRRFAEGMKKTVDSISPTLASQINAAHLLTEIGRQSWPFPDIDRTRFDQLKESQRYEIQGLVRERIERFEQANNESRPLGAAVAAEHVGTLTQLSKDAEARDGHTKTKHQRRSAAA